MLGWKTEHVAVTPAGVKGKPKGKSKRAAVHLMMPKPPTLLSLNVSSAFNHKKILFSQNLVATTNFEHRLAAHFKYPGT